MLINQMVGLSPEDDAEIIEAEDDPFHLATRGQLDQDMFPIPADSVEKLILNVHLVFHHAMDPPLPQKVLISISIS